MVEPNFFALFWAQHMHFISMEKVNLLSIFQFIKKTDNAWRNCLIACCLLPVLHTVSSDLPSPDSHCYPGRVIWSTPSPASHCYQGFCLLSHCFSLYFHVFLLYHFLSLPYSIILEMKFYYVDIWKTLK